jgi:hypothetical protein
MQEIPPVGLPVRAALHPTGLYLMLRQIAPDDLQDAFMFETVSRSRAPETVVQISKDDIGRVPPNSAPAGLVFHVGRCGSTLISQLLKQHRNLVVYAEPLPVNELLVPPHKWPRRELVAALRSLGAAFAGHAQRPYVIKLTSWNALYCDILLEAFPETPWILNYRDPVEVGVSIMNQLPGWLKDGAEQPRQLVDSIDPKWSAKPVEERIARSYGALCEAIARLDPKLGKLVAYDALPSAVWEVIAPHFAVSIDQRERRLMGEAAKLHAKAPLGRTAPFAPDTTTKQAAASSALRQAIDIFARPPLERLVALHAQ